MSRSPSLSRRFFGLLGAWTLLVLATPGCLFPGGSSVLAILGVGVFGAASLIETGKRGKRTFLVEWLANGIGGAATVYWIWYVVPFGLAASAFVLGFYLALGGWLLRLFARRVPITVAVCLAWLGAETLRTVLLPPLGLGWFLLGFHAADDAWLAGSARVWGVEGLTFVLAALAGLVAELLRSKRVSRGALAFAASAVALAAALSLFTAPPETEPGPRLMVVQPSIPQSDKQFGDRSANHERIVRLTLESLARDAADGAEPVDLVCWGETMFQSMLVEPAAEAAFAAGTPLPPWRRDIDQDDFRYWKSEEDRLVRRGLLDRLPRGTSFLTGAVVLDDVGDELRLQNSVVLYDAEGVRSPAADKRFLVPGAETMLGLERWDWVRDLAKRSINYVPEFVASDETGVLELTTRSGRTYGIAGTVCFDNAFLESYVEPLARRSVDFHLIVTNEDWYRGAFELDQMVAFSRLAAIATGRSMVRVANSGISVVLLPDGSELERLRVDGRDRSVEGVLVHRIPVPVRGDSEVARTPYVALQGPIRWLIAALTLAFCLWGRSAPVAR